jgi:ribonuclease HI
MLERPFKKVVLYFDGASKGNPGPAGAGAVLMLNSHVAREIKQFLGNSTNNQAEYTALLLGLEAARQMGATHVEVYGDSELVVEQLLGNYQVKDEKLKPLYSKVMDMARLFEEVHFKHIPREENKLADALANQAVKEGNKILESFEVSRKQALFELRIESPKLFDPAQKFIAESLKSLSLAERGEPAASLLEALEKAWNEADKQGKGLFIRFFSDGDVAIMQVELESRQPHLYQHFKIPH